ncbi:MAG TPA: hypothetical protein VFU23_06105 [Gemmatimonadales bacterium]|nr:hypothetical protein [Gemmatimonadales bacterium]
MPPTIRELRRLLAPLPGLVPAALVPPASHGREDEACITPATLIEPGPVTARAVGAAEAWPGPVAFLDGTQRIEVVGYVGTSPLIVAEVAAAVRERVGRETRTVQVERRMLAVARPGVLAAAAGALAGIESAPLPDEEPGHPLQDVDAARHVVDRARGDAERIAGTAYRSRSPHWLVVDGSLSESPAWARDPKMVGVSKSHSTLPFEGEDLVTYLHLSAGHRSSIFQPASRRQAPVHAWGLRLWPWAGKDLLYGLVRVEVAASESRTVSADQLSRWVLAERAPISAPDARWDRLLYGVRGVEEYLRATGNR